MPFAFRPMVLPWITVPAARPSRRTPSPLLPEIVLPLAARSAADGGEARGVLDDDAYRVGQGAVPNPFRPMLLPLMSVPLALP